MKTATLRTSRGGLSLRFRPRVPLVTGACLLVALALAVVAIGLGDYPLAPGQVLSTLVGQGSTTDAFIVHELRLPRVVTALTVGAALALSGAVFQSLVRNPLGSPDILGFTHGAATGALTTVVVFHGSSLALAGGAVAGGLATGVLIYVLAWRQGVHGYRLVLVGIGVAAILTGVNGFLLTKAQLTDAARAVLWLTGSLDGRGWEDVTPLLAVSAVLVPLLLATAPAMRMLELGDDTASGLGVRVEPTRLALLAAAVVLASCAAAAAGPVAFVALTAPQVARRLTGVNGPNLLPSACTGAALLVAADWAAQRVLDGRQLPVGVVTGVLGGGALIWMLAAQRRAGRI